MPRRRRRSPKSRHQGASPDNPCSSASYGRQNSNIIYHKIIFDICQLPRKSSLRRICCRHSNVEFVDRNSGVVQLRQVTEVPRWTYRYATKAQTACARLHRHHQRRKVLMTVPGIVHVLVRFGKGMPLGFRWPQLVS